MTASGLEDNHSVLTKASSPVPPPAAHRWIKTDCGRAKFAELAARRSIWARLRLIWFVLIAALRDWPLPQPDQVEGSES